MGATATANTAGHTHGFGRAFGGGVDMASGVLGPCLASYKCSNNPLVLFVQVFGTSVLMYFWLDLPEFPTES